MQYPIGKTLVLFCLLASTAMADSDGYTREPPRGGHRRPPQEAFDACKGKTEGASVMISTPHGSFKATCRNFEGSLAAAPEGAPPRDGNGSPKER